MSVNSDGLVAGLIQRHGAQIRHILKRRTASVVLDRTTLDDLYQEIVAEALRSAGTFEYHDDARFIGWITTIARRTVGRHVAAPAKEPPTVRLKRDDSTGLGVFASQVTGKEDRPSQIFSAEEGAKQLHRAINSLPEDYRRGIILYKIEERSLSEVAAAMGRSKVATCRLLARALSKLRKKLET